MTTPRSDALVRIENLHVRLPLGGDRRYAVEGLSLDIHRNEVFCIVGESGSGKSVTAGAIMGLLPKGQLSIESGSIWWNGEDLTVNSEDRMRTLRGAAFAMIFQEPMTALNPLMRIGDQIEEVLIVHGYGHARTRKDRVAELIAAVGLPDPELIARSYPFRLSGGQRQRAMIAMALALEPPLLIADEPTTALDVTTQSQVLRLIKEIQRKQGNGVLFITHDFGVVAEIADRVAVMQNGVVVEQGRAEDVLNSPQHAYTRKLISAIPSAAKREAKPHPPARDLAVEVRGLRKSFRRKALFRGSRQVRALNDVTLSVGRGETLGIVGESGSGKSTLARCLVRLESPDAGDILLFGRDVQAGSKRDVRDRFRKIQMVFQDPFASLNPRRKVGDSIMDGPVAQGMSRGDAQRRMLDLMDLVGLDPLAALRYPHEFSGGQRQRIGIARALATEPEILVADEAVSALDVSVQAQVLALLSDIKRRLGLTMLFITHDLRVAGQICDRVAVMRDGRLVELGAVDEVFHQPAEAYTRALLDAVPGRDRFLNQRPKSALVG